jgi:hypothetical protein
MPLSLDPGIDLRRTTYLSRMIQRWGRLPLLLLNGVDPRAYRYAYIGSDDWSMYPVLQPGSLVLIDETKRRIQNAGWTSDYDRPVYLLEHRGGFVVGWCSLTEGHVVVQPHPSSESAPQVFSWPAEIDVVGQVVGVAMRFEGRRRRPKP